MNDTGREPNHYEYRFKTTPEYIVIEEEIKNGQALPQWELFDVFIKRLDNGYTVFVAVFRRRVIK